MKGRYLARLVFTAGPIWLGSVNESKPSRAKKKCVELWPLYAVLISAMRLLQTGKATTPPHQENLGGHMSPPPSEEENDTCLSTLTANMSVLWPRTGLTAFGCIGLPARKTLQTRSSGFCTPLGAKIPTFLAQQALALLATPPLPNNNQLQHEHPRCSPRAKTARAPPPFARLRSEHPPPLPDPQFF